MTSKTTPEELSTRALIDRIGNALPKDIRDAYFREMAYCRQLQESDEMLRILRVMQFLTLLMEQVPERVAINREKLEQLFAAANQSLEKTLHASLAHQHQLDQRLVKLPEIIAAGMEPKAVAAKINESLHQEFLKSTIPETARTLGVIAEQIKKTASEFGTTAGTLGMAYSGAAADARQAIDSLSSTIRSAAKYAQSAAEDLSSKFKDAYWGTLIGLSVTALLLGLFFGTVLDKWIAPPREKIIERVLVSENQPEPPPTKMRRGTSDAHHPSHVER